MALFLYSKITDNKLLKIFHFVTQGYSFPLTAVVAVVVSLFFHHYLYIVFYFTGLFCLTTAEDHLSKKTIINSALTSQGLFENLHKRGAIIIKDIAEPDVPVRKIYRKTC